MKRTFKILGYLIGIIVLLLGAGASFIWFRGIPTYEADIPAHIAGLNVPRDSAYVERGAKIATLLCNACHKGEEGKLTGRQMNDLPAIFGTVYSMNITQDPVHGIGKWTYQQFHEAVKFNKNPRGGPLYYPMFPHTTLTDTEISGIWAYLQTVPPLKNQVGRYQAK